jgi:hypothetical protein
MIVPDDSAQKPLLSTSKLVFTHKTPPILTTIHPPPLPYHSYKHRPLAAIQTPIQSQNIRIPTAVARRRTVAAIRIVAAIEQILPTAEPMHQAPRAILATNVNALASAINSSCVRSSVLAKVDERESSLPS